MGRDQIVSREASRETTCQKKYFTKTNVWKKNEEVFKLKRKKNRISIEKKITGVEISQECS